MAATGPILGGAAIGNATSAALNGACRIGGNQTPDERKKTQIAASINARDKPRRDAHIVPVCREFFR
jgi:hypothetical protein